MSSENLTPEQLNEAGDRERLRRDRWSFMSLDEKIEALAVRISDEVERLYSYEFPMVDEQIHRAINESYDVGNEAREQYNESVRAVRTTTEAFKNSIQATLDATVRDLIRKSDSKVVAAALSEALRSTVLITRTASREEARSKETLVIRTASPAEIREQQ